MLEYDHARTEQIVQRLRDGERAVRYVSISAAIFIFAAIGLLAGGFVAGDGSQVVGAFVGGCFGFVVGGFWMILISAVLEWMCQILIAAGKSSDVNAPPPRL